MEPALVDSTKRNLMRTLFCSILFTGLVAACAFGEETGRPVHLRPSTDSPILGELPPNAFVMAPPEPVELSEAERKAGWEPISYLDNLRGFVKRSDVTKDLEVAPGAAVYSSAAENSSDVITRADG